jgi:hypothetical protein
LRGAAATPETMRCEQCRLAGLDAIAVVAACLDDSDVAVTPGLGETTDVARVTARLGAWLAEALDMNEQTGGVAAQEVLRKMSLEYQPTDGASP